MAFQVVHSIIFIIVHSALGSILVLLGCKFVKWFGTRAFRWCPHQLVRTPASL